MARWQKILKWKMHAMEEGKSLLIEAKESFLNAFSIKEKLRIIIQVGMETVLEGALIERVASLTCPYNCFCD